LRRARGEPREESLLHPTRSDRFEALFRDHAGRVYAYARRRTAPDEAEDIVAETFLVAWRRLDDVPTESLPWLLGVAHKVLANRWRATGRRLEFQRTLARTSSSRPDPADEVQTKLDVLAAIDRLPMAEREALTLSAWEGLTAAEASTVLGCTRATFAVRLHRARRRLMKELAAGEHFRAGGTADRTPSEIAGAADRIHEQRRSKEAEAR